MAHPDSSSDGSPVAVPPDNTTFVTDHLALAAFLTSHGHPPVLSAVRSGKVLFSFAQTTTLNYDVAAFSDGTAKVEPAAYDSARIQLRRQMDALRGVGR